MGDFAHFHVGVGAELFVLFLFVELMPPFVGAASIAGGVELGGVIKGEAFLAVVDVVALDAESFTGGEESEGAKAGAVGLDGEGVGAIRG